MAGTGENIDKEKSRIRALGNEALITEFEDHASNIYSSLKKARCMDLIRQEMLRRMGGK